MTLLELPDEMWEAIIEQIDPDVACTTLRNVCHHWRRVVERMHGPIVVIQTPDDIRRAKRMRKVGVLRLATQDAPRPYIEQDGWGVATPINAGNLKPVGEIREDSFFSEIASVLNKMTYLYIRHRIKADNVEAWVIQTSGVKLIGGGGIEKVFYLHPW